MDKLTLSYQLKPFNRDAINDPFGKLEDLGEGRYRITGNYPIQQGGTTTTHTFVLKAQDACRNTTELEVPFQVVDCKAPTPKCIFGLSTRAMPNGAISIAADWFDKGSFDFCSDVTLTFADPAIYPDSTVRTFTCVNGELGVVPVQLWARDAAGNAAFCETFVSILGSESDEFTENPCVNPTQGAALAGTIATEAKDGVENAEVQVSGAALATTKTSATGTYGVYNLEKGYDYSLTPYKDDDHLNGISTFDLVLISKHILNVQPLDSPYKIIAADINNSGSITTMDMVLLRRLILTIDQALTNNTSWRFIPADYVFQNPENPFAENFPEVMNINNLEANKLDLNFVAIKVGDINGSAIANSSIIEGRNFQKVLEVKAVEERIEKDRTIIVHLDMEHELSGYQFTLNYDNQQIELVNILDGAVHYSQIGVFEKEGAVTVSWNGEQSKGRMVSLVFRNQQPVALENALSISSMRTLSEAYDVNGTLFNLKLNFQTPVVSGFQLYQNIPNPFKDKTNIMFDLPSHMRAELTIHDVSGRVIYRKADQFQKGQNIVEIDRQHLASGVLYYTIATDGFIATKKMIVLE